MRLIRISAAPALFVSLLLSTAAAAQELRVAGEGVRLRAGASKFTRILRTLSDGEELSLVRPDSLRTGFFHVRSQSGEGWVGRDLVERLAARPLAGRAVAPAVVDAARPASSVSPGWEKPPAGA